MPNDGLVTAELIHRVVEQFTPPRPNEQFDALAAVEPELADWLRDEIACYAGLLQIYAASDEHNVQVCETLGQLATVAVEVMRRGHFELWDGTTIGAQLERRDPGLAKRARQTP
ncbi:MAG: hypothetical protein WD534_10285 [Phycisphaeraceae bacterium]